MPDVTTIICSRELLDTEPSVVPAPKCDGSYSCGALRHIHGCFNEGCNPLGQRVTLTHGDWTPGHDRTVPAWTATVAAVVPVVGPDCDGVDGAAHVCLASLGAAYFDGESDGWEDLPAADWTPGTFALRLADVERVA